MIVQNLLSQPVGYGLQLSAPGFQQAQHRASRFCRTGRRIDAKTARTNITLPYGGFETSGKSGLPAGWETWWTNSGNGTADQYNSGGADAFEGNSVLRLHTGPGGGSVFVLSDPIPITQGTWFQLTAQMRFCFVSNSDRAYFSVIQEDSSGRSVAFDEVTGVPGDSYWSWIARSIVVHPVPGASRMRIRFGLVTTSESYMDVDAVR